MQRVCRWWEKYQYKVFGLVLWTILLFFWAGLYMYYRMSPAKQCDLECVLFYPSSPTGLWACRAKCWPPKMKGDSATNGGAKKGSVGTE